MSYTVNDLACQILLHFVEQTLLSGVYSFDGKIHVHLSIVS